MISIPIYTLFSTVFTTFVFGIVYLFLSRQKNSVYLRSWGLCWAIFSAMFLLDFINLQIPMFKDAFLPLRQSLSLTGTLLFISGTFYFFQKKFPRIIYRASFFSYLLIASYFISPKAYNLALIPNVLFCSGLLILSACMFISHYWTQNLPEKIFASFLITLWAIYINSFGFSHSHITLAFFNYFVGVFIVNLVIVFLLIIHFKKTRFLIAYQAARYRTLVENSSDTMFLYNYKTRSFEYISPSIHKIVGVTASELYNDPFSFFDNLEVSQNEKYVLSIFKEPVPSASSATITFIHDGAPMVWSEIHYLPIYDDLGLVNSIEGILRDITEKKNIEESLIKSEQSRKELIENISHEIKTPVTLIQGYTESLLNNRLPEFSKKNYLELIHLKTKLLTGLLEELISVSNFSSQTLSYQFYELNAYNYFKKLCNQIRIQLENSGRIFKLNFEVEPSVIVILDEFRIDQVVSNLIKNAVLHTPENGTIFVSAKTSTNKITPVNPQDLSPIIPDGYLEFSVTDNGEGIREEDIPHIFQRGFRGESTIAQNGSGLGLYISKQIIEQHSGEIKVQNNLTGCSFIFTLPYYNTPSTS